jgi:outer membrane protein assembly factor BamB
VSCGRALVILLLAAAAVAGCSSKGKTKEPAKLTRIEQPRLELQRVWMRNIGNGAGKFYASLRVALAEDAVYAANVAGDVYALDPKSGALIWRARTRSHVMAGPSIAGDTILLGTLEGEVIALKRKDGAESWRVNSSSEVVAPPQAAGDTVVVKAGDGHCFGLSAHDGSRKWSFDRGEPELMLRGQSAPLIVDNRVYLGMDNGKLAALGLEDGQLAWEQTLSVPAGRSALDRLTDVDADLVEGPEGLYAVTYGGDLALIDTGTGDSRWRRSVKSYSGIALGADKVFVSDDEGLLWALDAGSGAASWKQDALKYRRLSPPSLFEDYVVAGDYEGWLHFFASSDGSLVGRVSLGSDAIVTAPVTGGGLLYAMDSGGRLAGYRVKLK